MSSLSRRSLGWKLLSRSSNSSSNGMIEAELVTDLDSFCLSSPSSGLSTGSMVFVADGLKLSAAYGFTVL